MTTTAFHNLRELDHRRSDGIDVHLLWNERNNELLLSVADLKTGDAFSIEVTDHARALDAFRHPYAYVAAA